jgi:hypothetical protein
VAGAWSLENLEPKATLRAIIGEGSFEAFTQWLLANQQRLFEAGLKKRVTAAVADNRISGKAAALLLDPTTTFTDLLELEPPTDTALLHNAA